MAGKTIAKRRKTDNMRTKIDGRGMGGTSCAKNEMAPPMMEDWCKDNFIFVRNIASERLLLAQNEHLDAPGSIISSMSRAIDIHMDTGVLWPFSPQSQPEDPS
jgi:hypothetical protein